MEKKATMITLGLPRAAMESVILKFVGKRELYHLTQQLLTALAQCPDEEAVSVIGIEGRITQGEWKSG
jgi:hypothetical protein